MNKRFGPLLLALSCVSSLACTSDSVSGIDHSVVVTELGFVTRTGEERDGVEVSSGLDLDGLVSDRTDVAGCNRADFMSPEGFGGVDNQFTFLFEAVEEIFPNTVEGIIQGTINEGRLLLMFELNGVDDLRNDDEVEVRIFLGEGRPDLSAANRIVPDQTFDEKPGAPVSVTTGRIVDGVVEAGPFDVEFPVAVFNVFFDLRLEQAALRAQIHEDGTMTGLFGGGLSSDQILNVAQMADEMQGIEISPVLRVLLPRWVDLGKGEDGRCTQVSTTMRFTATTAFTYAEPLSE